MTFNAEWLWTPFDNKVDGSLKHLNDMTAVNYLEEINFYAQQIRAKRIDVVAISEIENEQVVTELATKIGKGWHAYFKQGRDTATGQDVALLSRLPYVEGSLTDFDFPSGYIAGQGKAKKISKIVGAQFWLNEKVNNTIVERKLGVITAHLLSKRNENKKKMTDREKQALALNKAIDIYQKEVDALIVMGDFNDQLNSPTLDILLKAKLNTFKDCGNFLKEPMGSDTKRWLRHIDHLLYAGLFCKSQYKLDLQQYSDHHAIYGEFTMHQSK